MNNKSIHIAIIKNDLVELKKCIKNGTDINSKGEYNCTPLHYACQNGNFEIIEFLVSNLANINMKNSYSTYYPIFDAITATNDKNVYDIIKLLLDNGADINSIDSFGNTLLHYAVEKENIALVQLLLTSGCKVNQTKRHDKDTALHYAYFQKNKQIISMLIDAGANIHALNLYNKQARNYLETAI